MKTRTRAQLCKAAIVELVSEHDGRWGWYELDRALGFKGLLCPKLVDLLNGLVAEGLLTVSGDPQLSSSKYSLRRAPPSGPPPGKVDTSRDVE